MCQEHAEDHCPEHSGPRRTGHARGLGRRTLLATSAAAALTLEGVSFAHGAAADTPAGTPRDAGGAKQSRTVSGTLPPGCPDYVYLPVEVPSGVRELHVSYTYDKPEQPPGTQGNALDIGLFDERGTDLGGAGFRGWSGGARTEFFVRADDATPGYLAGPVNPGTWYVALGPYTVSPDGLPYQVTVTLTRGEQGSTPKPTYPPERARGRGRAWYRGDCHLHSVYSDGKRTPGEIAALAREAGLDFIHSADHNTNASHPFWAEHAGDDLLIMLGEEITTRNGHVVALSTRPGAFIDWRYRARDNRFGRFAQEVHRQGGLVVPAHPHSTTCVACNWKFGFNEADAVEIWNGPYTLDDEATLADWDNRLSSDAAGVRAGHGSWLPGMGNSDAHRDPDVVGLPQTVVLADELSRDAILAGIKAGRSYVAGSSEVEVAFTVSGPHGEQAGIGERLRVDAASQVTVRLDVKGAPGCTTHLVTDEGTRFTGPALPASGAGTIEWQTTPQNSAYVRAEVRHPSADDELPGPFAALTNPVFLGA